MIRVLIAEDQAMVRGALAALLTTEGDFEIAGDAPNGRAALDLARTLLPDVLLTDIEMPELTGLELAAEIKRLHLPVKVVILTTFARAGYLRRALDAGVSGYLLKDAPASTLANAIRRIRAGARVIDPELAAEAWTEADPLTDRERQVLRHAGDGRRAPKSPNSSTSPKAPCATISPRPSANSVPPIARKPPASPISAAGCRTGLLAGPD